eukprot:CAMPEP_0118835272 /NCGR_PEP_ID=MMETSP1162-20130426/53554_1 /TAXON_ID=33656 /ORGANISM="Phaeocystis Sp, Strain CCMP2710" /LENGTH=66 /DNA_ID=CAMNT_0006767023 /DNA_START=75 /DNA_END=272 /DNA_ORIENTATION=+
MHGRVEGVLLEDVGAPQCVRSAKVADAGEHLHRREVDEVRDEELGVEVAREPGARSAAARVPDVGR